MNEQELNDVVCNQCNRKVRNMHRIVKIEPPSTIAYGCKHCVIDYFNDKIANYILYYNMYKLETHPHGNKAHFWVYVNTSDYIGWKLINTFEHVPPLPVKDGVLEIDKLIQRLLNMKAFY